MEEHGLQPTDQPELGDHSTAGEILNGKRSLTLTAAQIRALGTRKL